MPGGWPPRDCRFFCLDGHIRPSQPSSQSGLNYRVEVLELDPGALGREAPVDATTGPVARRLPRRDLPLQRRPVGQHTQLDLGHVQPAAMLGVSCSSSRSASRLASAGANASYSDAGVWVFGVVLHQHDPLGVGVVNLQQVLDAVRPVDAGAPRADHDVAPAAQRLADEEQVAHPAALVLIILACWPAGLHRHGRGDLRQELAAGLIQAHLRVARIVGLGVDPKHVLHAPHELGIVLGRDAPAFLQPRLEAVCCKAWRTVSYDTDSTNSSSTSRSASSRNVQRLRPSGGALHASATRWASCSPSSLRRYSRSGALRSTAASRPRAAYCWRTRATVVWWSSSGVAIAR